MAVSSIVMPRTRRAPPAISGPREEVAEGTPSSERLFLSSGEGTGISNSFQEDDTHSPFSEESDKIFPFLGEGDGFPLFFEEGAFENGGTFFCDESSSA